MLTVEERFGRNRSDATVPMAGVVPGEERLAVRSGGLEGGEADWELGAILHGPELGFRERIVVGDMRTAV